MTSDERLYEPLEMRVIQTHKKPEDPQPLTGIERLQEAIAHAEHFGYSYSVDWNQLLIRFQNRTFIFKD